MVFLIICVAILSATTGVVQANQHQSGIFGSLKAHKVIASWDEAETICRSEGAFLATPINVKVLNEMKYLMDANHRYNTYFIGTRARHIPGQFLSIEGVTIDEMPVFDMLERLDPAEGDCLAMDDKKIYVVPCWTPLPYMCRLNSSDCGSGYQYVLATGSCYKLHTELKTWDNAAETCVSENGYLAIINDDTEVAECKKIIKLKMFPTAIGLRDRLKNGSWESVHGTRLEGLYNKWNGGAIPNSNDRCCRLLPNGKLDDYYCEAKQSFLCEKQPDNRSFTSKAT